MHRSSVEALVDDAVGGFGNRATSVTTPTSTWNGSSERYSRETDARSASYFDLKKG